MIHHLKFRSNKHPVFYPLNLATLRTGACLLGLSASMKTRGTVRGRTLRCGHPDSRQSVFLKKERSWRACFLGAAMSTVLHADARAPQGLQLARMPQRKTDIEVTNYPFKPLHFHVCCCGSGTWYLFFLYH